MVRTIKDIDIKNKTVIIRCDYNVPIEKGKILDDTRIKSSLETINYALKNNCKIIILSHLGRIKEESDLKRNTLKPVAIRLSKLLNKKVKFINTTRGKELEEAVKKMKKKEIILVENTRYEDLDGKKESKNDKSLAEYWASLGEVFINDAFGTCHRAHASNVGISSYLPSAIGFLIEKELAALEELKCPKKPFVVILGGKKVSDKIGVIENLITKVDYLLIGGGMAFTFLKAEGYTVGGSIVDNDSLTFCKKILKKYEDKIVLPLDIKTNTKYDNEGKIQIKDITELSEEEIGLDIGPKTVEVFKTFLKTSQLVLWNGPLGVYEFSNFKKSTDDLLKYLTDENIKTILGGGDIVAAASLAGVKDKIYHASTGGGATLEYLEGKSLPGIDTIK